MPTPDRPFMPTRARRCVATCALLLSQAIDARVAAAPIAAAAGSAASPARQVYRVEALEVEVELEPEKASYVLGEPIYLVFRARKRSGGELYTHQGGDTINALGRPSRFQLEVIDAGGAALPDPLAALNEAVGGNSLSGPRPIGPKGWEQPLLLADWATLKKAGHYTVSLRHELRLGRSAAQASSDRAATAKVELRTTLDVLPADAEALGKIIETYGRQAAAAGPDEGESPARRAMTALAIIDDARTMPYLITAARRGSYSAKFVAVGALARFVDDRALQALASALHDVAPNIQASAAAALARSKHPLALAALWAARTASAEAVRLTVVHAVARKRSPLAEARLRELSRDRSKLVSDEAKRYLAERGR